MEKPRDPNLLFPTLSRVVPSWILWVIIIFTFGTLALAISTTSISVSREEARRTIARAGCREGIRPKLIVLAGMLANEDLSTIRVCDCIPQVRGMDEKAAAEWIVRNFDSLRYDEGLRQFRADQISTTQP